MSSPRSGEPDWRFDGCTSVGPAPLTTRSIASRHACSLATSGMRNDARTTSCPPSSMATTQRSAPVSCAAILQISLTSRAVVAERVERAAQIEERADVLALDDHRLHRAEHAPLGVRQRLDAGGDRALRFDGGGVDRVQLGAHRRRQLGLGAADALLDGVDEAMHLARDVEARGAQIVGELFDLVRGDLIGGAAAEQAERFAHALEIAERAVLAEELLRAREPRRGRADLLAVELALGVADEVAVGEVAFGELARHVARGDEIDGAREHRFGAREIVARRLRLPATSSAALRSRATRTPAPRQARCRLELALLARAKGSQPRANADVHGITDKGV